MKLRTVCFACVFCLLLPLTACTPKVAAEPTPTPTATETPAPAETLETLLAGLTAEEIGSVSWGGPNECVTAEELAPMLREAAKHTVDYDRLAANGATPSVWWLDFYVGDKGQDGYSGEYAVHLYAGLEENLVEVSAGGNLPEGRLCLEDKALYQRLRTQNDKPDGEIDQEAYAAYRETVDAYLARSLPEKDGVTFTRELTSFRQVAEAPELGALVYCVATVLSSNPPEKVLVTLSGGAYVDSQLRASGENEQNNLVVVDGVPIGFVSWGWLEFDGLTKYATAEELIATVKTGNL